MSSYDRRTWQRPPGERTADPAWVFDVEDATGRLGKARVPSVDAHGDHDIYGNIYRQYGALAPKYRESDGTD